MLYKKYHRNYVKQFKRGVKFSIISVETIMKEPWYNNIDKVICVAGSKFGSWNLVYSDGRIDKCRLYVIQEISQELH